jgi:PncC family amidohydrolase
MDELINAAARIAEVLKNRNETLAVAESSTGGLISAAMLAIPGASAYFIAGAVVYTLKARRTILDLPDAAFAGMKGLTEDAALVFARAARLRFGVVWALSEIGASGPTGSRYGDPAGTTCIAVVGPVEKSAKIHTASADRVANMKIFSARALELLEACVGAPRQ